MQHDVLIYTVYPLLDDAPHDSMSGVLQSPMDLLLGHTQFQFKDVILLFRQNWGALARRLGERAMAEHNIPVEYVQIPCLDDSEVDDVADFYIRIVSEPPFNDRQKKYYIFSEGMDFLTRVFTYSMATLQMHKWAIVAVPYDWKNQHDVYVSSADLRYYGVLAERIQAIKGDGQTYLKAGIPTRDVAFNRMIEQVETVTLCSRDPILLYGPTGCGKSLLARRIHELRQARGLCIGQYVEVNCASIRGDMAQSLLFGHVRGAFTGAVQSREGMLRTAKDGMLFLDEVGTLGLSEQALLLRALEEHRFFPVGSDKEVSSNFMLICGTNQDLVQEARAGRFRNDLLARINTWQFRMPALRERPADIVPNLDFELRAQSQTRGQHMMFTPEARDLFQRYAISPQAHWPSNFRSFSNAVRRMCAFATTGIIDTKMVEEEIARLRSEPDWEDLGHAHTFAHVLAVLGTSAPYDMDLFECSQLENVLEVCAQCHSLAETGRRLFAVSRQQKGGRNDSDRIRKYLARYGLTWADVKEGIVASSIATTNPTMLTNPRATRSLLCQAYDQK